jgi:hypothetical protein
MRYVRAFLLVAAAAGCGGCFQMGTVVHVKGDASGTIDQRLVFSQAALAQLKQFAMLGGGKTFDPVSEEQARADAAKLGPGVTLASSSVVSDDAGQGRASVYRFADINQLRVNQQPGAPGGVSVKAEGMDTLGPAITFALTHLANGNALMTIAVPQPKLISAGMTQGTVAGNAPSAEQISMLKDIFSGARVTIAVEPIGTLVKTSSAFVDGPRVTLLDINLDQLLKDETLLPRMQAAKTADDMKAILKDAPGLKINLDREITIEFTPAK